MGEILRGIGRNKRWRHQIDAYIVSAIAIVFALMSAIGDIVDDDLRWAALLAGVGLLVHHITLPESSKRTKEILANRSAFDRQSFPTLLHTARELWIFAPAAVNVLSPHHCGVLRDTVLANPAGVVRVVVLDPARDDAMRVASRHLDDSRDGRLQMFRASLQASLAQLRRLSGRRLPGSFEYRLLDFNPGFSLVAVDPGTRHGFVIVEFHGFHNEATASRMHIRLSRQTSEEWYEYWLSQYDRLWRSAREPQA